MVNRKKWSVQEVIELTKLYTSRTQFQKDHGAPYWWAKKNGLLNEIFPHLPPITKRGHWASKSNVLEEARKYKSRMEFRTGARRAYDIVLKNQWNEIFDLFKKEKRPLKCDDKQRVIQEAKKFRTRTEFQKYSNSAWRSAKKNGWEEAFSHMEELVKPNGYWDTYENCKKATLKCTTKLDFREKYRTAYEKVKANNWNELLDHMTDPRIGRQAYNIAKEARELGWCMETILPIAQQYKTRSEFNKARPAVYKEAMQQGILDEVCSNMKPQGNHFKRGIYAIEFADNTVYVGLTYNFRMRFNQHKRNSSNPGVKKRLINRMPHKFIKYDKLLSPQEALQEEDRIAYDYIQKGYTLLNRGKLGGGASLGGGWKAPRFRRK
ncbi:MAG: putative GIY-YIG superfamily endonuclease [Desulforhopalus sp.]|jgi:predicted GIY-YIG superfamily endonuclease